LKERGANQRAATNSERDSLVIFSAERCLGARAAHITAKATDSIPQPDGMLDLSGVSSGDTLGKSIVEQEKPHLAVGSDKDREY
jgi:hypothetical protein